MAEHLRARAAAAVAVASALALVACGGGGGEPTAAEQLEEAFGDLGQTEETGDEDGIDDDTTTTTTGEAELTPVDLDLPRETTYLGATWTVDEVSYRSAGVDEMGFETGPAAVVGYTVANTGDDAPELRMSSDRLWLLDGDDFAIPAEPDYDGDDTLAVGGRSSFETVFPLDDGVEADDLADYTFRVGSDGYVPALVPLSGEPPPSDYPLAVTVPESIDGYTEVYYGGRRDVARLRPTSASAVLDFADKRAEEGTRMFVIEAEIDILEAGNAYLNSSDLALSVDGIVAELIHHELPPMTTELPTGSTTTGTWVFVIPADGSAAVLHFGKDSEPDAKGGAFTFPEMP